MSKDTSETTVILIDRAASWSPDTLTDPERATYLIYMIDNKRVVRLNTTLVVAMCARVDSKWAAEEGKANLVRKIHFV